jgi:hypothetical protein
MSFEAHIANLPNSTREAVEAEARRREMTPVELAAELTQRYVNDASCRRRVERITGEILKRTSRKKSIKHLIPRDTGEALLIQLVLNVRAKKLWPDYGKAVVGPGKVVMKSIELPSSPKQKP